MNCTGECISDYECTESKTFVIVVMTLFFAIITGGQCFYIIINKNRVSEPYLLQNNDIPPPYDGINSER